MALRTGHMTMAATSHKVAATLVASYTTVIALSRNRAIPHYAPFAMAERTISTLFAIIVPICIAITTRVATVVIATGIVIGGVVVLIGWRGRGCIRATTTA